MAYNTGPPAQTTLTIGSSDGTGDLMTVQCPSTRCEPTDWSRDGRWLLADVYSSKDVDVWMLSATGESPRPLLDAPFVERDARLSPDGALVTYVSEEAGRPEVSIETVPMPGGAHEMNPGTRCWQLQFALRRLSRVVPRSSDWLVARVVRA